jgi:endogenous inhibitor of DNA gyrase (YacG/DUF329 family)
MKCPICKKEVPFTGPDMPFCSARCRLLDLGKWADEQYRIPASEPPPALPPADPGADE